MPRISHSPVIRHSEHAQYPLHYRGKTFPATRLNNKMEMVSHNAEIFQAEIILRFRPLHDSQEQILYGGSTENHLLAVGSRSHMVASPVYQLSRLPHAHYTRIATRVDLIDIKK